MKADRPEWAPGDALPPLELPPVTRLDLIKYAGASGDYNPIHTIDEEAHRAGLPGVIQHGMLTMAQMGRLFSPYFDRSWVTRFQTRFRGMLFVGERLRVIAEVSALDTSVEGDRYTFDLTATTAEGRTIATGSLELLWYAGADP